MERKPITIGLFGFGCVGFGLYEVLQATPGLRANIKTICAKDRHKERPGTNAKITFDPDEILEDPEINVVVELIDDTDAAFGIVRKAMVNGKSVVSANKKMISAHFQELFKLQREYKVSFLYEAACCASIPIIRNLEEYYDNDMLQSIEGIVNGSTNYILTKTSEENIDFPEALSQAQAAGYAESDPTLDISGADAKYKLMILLAHAFGLVVKPEEIYNLGIDRIGTTELQYAREKGLKIKLIASAIKNEDGSVTAFVAPRFIPPHKKLFHVDDVYNGVVAQTSFADTQFFVGKGAGAHPTASAVLSDISALSYNYRYEYRKVGRPEGVALKQDAVLKILLSFRNDLSAEQRSKFKKIDEYYQNGDNGFVIGSLALNDLKDITEEGRSSVVLC